MTKAIVDTTILTDILLNSGEITDRAKNALNKFAQTLLPVYAIKEFKAGPLKNFVWFHNKFVILGSYGKAIDALQRMSRTPKRYTTSTALQALKEASGSIGQQSQSDLEKKYGKAATLDQILCDEIRITLKFKIISAWKKRRKITSDVICPLICYREVAPYEKRGLIELDPKDCDGEVCQLANLLKSDPNKLRKMRDAISDSTKLENQHRSKVLRQLYRTPNRDLQRKNCKYLGDAVFVFLASNDTIVLTSNISDFQPLAQAVGTKAIRPDDISI